jgi:hypothetical protein
MGEGIGEDGRISQDRVSSVSTHIEPGSPASRLLSYGPFSLGRTASFEEIRVSSPFYCDLRACRPQNSWSSRLVWPLKYLVSEDSRINSCSLRVHSGYPVVVVDTACQSQLERIKGIAIR